MITRKTAFQTTPNPRLTSAFSSLSRVAQVGKAFRQGTLSNQGLLFGICTCLWFVAIAAPTARAQSVTVTNVFENHYAYDFPISPAAVDCPSGYTIDSTQYNPSGQSTVFHLERGHAIHHADSKTPANDYWVYWAHFDNASYGTAEVAVFKSTTECGPYVLQTNLYTGSTPTTVTDPNAVYNADGYGYGFRPGGWQSRDEIIFRDAATQSYNPDGSVASYASAYLITASNSLNTIPGNSCSYANDSLAGFKLTPDYLGIDTSTSVGTNGANWIFPCAQREAPVLFRSGNYYFLVVSQAAGWYPSQGAYGASTNPLTGFPASPVSLGNTSTFGGQTSDGFTIAGTQATSYILEFDHLGGDDSKNPAYTGSRRDSGIVYLPLTLDGTSGTATLNWEPSFTVNTTTGVLTLPSLPNLATSATATATVASATANPPSYAIDGNYYTRWASTSTGTAAFAAAKSTTSTLCPVTNATSATTCNPSLVVDLGAVQPVQEIDLSWYMIKGSEPYYNFKIAYSSDNLSWNTLDYTAFAYGSNATASNISAVPFSNNNTYGFNSLPVNFNARFVALVVTGEVVQNNSPGNYGPNVYEMAVIKSTAPASPQPVTVTVAPTSTSVSPSAPVTVNVTVSGPTGSPTPSGYIQLSAPGYSGDTYGLVNGANRYTIPAGSLTGGTGNITVAYRPDATSAPVYGIGTTTGVASISVSTPDAPTNLALTQVSPGALSVSWTASTGATGYVVNRSSDGGNTFTQVGTSATTAYTDSGLNNDSTSYCYTVAAVNAAGMGSVSSSACSTATANFPITGLAVAQSGPGALTVSYTAISTATGYVIKRSVGGAAYSTLTTATSTSYTDSGLTTASYYCYTVAAVFSTGTASDSSPICGTVAAGYAPMGVTVTPTADGQLTVSWTSGSSTTTNYLVKRSINGGAYTTVVASQSALTYADTGLTDYSNTYCYVIDAVLNGQTSSDSLAACNVPVAFVSVPNYSFETPTTTTYVYNPASSTASWIFTASGTAIGSGVTTNGSGFTASNSVAPDGTQIGFLQGKGSATQTLSGFVTGQTYKLIVAASQRQNKSGGQLGNPFNINVNGATISTVTAPQTTKTYTDYSSTFTAPAASFALQFAGTNGLATATYPDNTVFIDNVRISPLGTSTAPITVQPMTIAQGAAFAVLTATETFSGTAPAGTLIFQVNGGTQVASACSITGTTETCTATYPTATLAQGTGTIMVTYPGDPTYLTSSASGSLTVNDASTGTVELITTTTLTKLVSGGYSAAVTVQNTGTTTATAAALTSMSIGGATGSPVPTSLGDIAPGGAAAVTLTLPSSIGSTGNTVVERFTGTYSGGTFGGGLRTALP